MNAYDEYSKDFLNGSGLILNEILKGLMSLKFMGLSTFARSPLNHLEGGFSPPISLLQSPEGFSSIRRLHPQKELSYRNNTCII